MFDPDDPYELRDQEMEAEALIAIEEEACAE